MPLNFDLFDEELPEAGQPAVGQTTREPAAGKRRAADGTVPVRKPKKKATPEAEADRPPVRMVWKPWQMLGWPPQPPPPLQIGLNANTTDTNTTNNTTTNDGGAAAPPAPPAADTTQENARRAHRRVVELRHLPRGFTAGKESIGHERERSTSGHLVPKPKQSVVRVDGVDAELPSPTDVLPEGSKKFRPQAFTTQE